MAAKYRIIAVDGQEAAEKVLNETVERHRSNKIADSGQQLLRHGPDSVVRAKRNA